MLRSEKYFAISVAAWLGPLKAALGPLVEAYPAVPDFPN